MAFIRSTRQYLIEQGVTDEPALRKHMMFMFQMQRAVYPRSLDLYRYRVNPENPNSFPPMMG